MNYCIVFPFVFLTYLTKAEYLIGSKYVTLKYTLMITSNFTFGVILNDYYIHFVTFFFL